MRVLSSHIAGFHILDKLSVFVAPFARVVWIDADIMVSFPLVMVDESWDGIWYGAPVSPNR